MSITFDPVFEKGEKLSRDQVIRELIKRIGNKDMHMLNTVVQSRRNKNEPSSAMHVTAFLTEVLEEALAGVDDKYLTREFAVHGDIRPLLQQAYKSENLDEQHKSVAISLIPTMTEILDRQIDEQWPAAQLDDDDKATIDAMKNAWRGGQVKSLNLEPQTTTDMRTGQVSVFGAPGSIAEGIFGDMNADGSAVTSRRFISESEWRRMLRSDQDDISSLLLQEELMRAGTGSSYVDPATGTEISIQGLGVQWDDSRTPPAGAGERGTFGELANTPGNIPENIRNPRLEQKWYGISEVFNKPYTMNEEERTEIHRKMKAAGIFDIAGGEPMIPGDVSDPAFKRAWKYLVTKSAAENKSMMSILQEQTSAYQQAVNAQLATQLTDPARVRLNANAMARSAIGRHLSDEEQTQLTKFIHDLERKNARMAAGLEVTATGESIEGVDAQSEGTLYDIDAQIDQWIESNRGDEAGAHDMAESYQMFTRMLGGPGRGVS
jgi:hypothetical protein